MCGLADGDHVANASVQLTGATDENTSNDDFSASFETTSGGDVTMTVLTDQYPNETTWTIVDESGSTVWTGGPYSINSRRIQKRRVCPMVRHLDGQ